ncbi:MAG: protein tyrosine phosphatase [Pseudomonadota bacterium]
MPKLLSREEFQTPAGRQRAQRALTWGDHGILRNFYDNTHEVSPGKLWRTYQPGPRKLSQWKERGIKTVINLRGDKLTGFYLLEEEACRDLGLDLVTIRAYSREAPSHAFLKSARDLFASITYPAVLHCKSGADRAGLMSTLYLFFEENIPLPEAMVHLSRRYGHIRQGKTGVIDFALEKFIAHARERDIAPNDPDAFLHWAATEYDPTATKNEFTPQWWGNVLTDIVLRRE